MRALGSDLPRCWRWALRARRRRHRAGKGRRDARAGGAAGVVRRSRANRARAAARRQRARRRALHEGFERPEAFVGARRQGPEPRARRVAIRALRRHFRCGPGKGRYQIEVTGEKISFGPTVVANFPLSCGEAPRTLRRRGAARRAKATRSFDDDGGGRADGVEAAQRRLRQRGPAAVGVGRGAGRRRARPFGRHAWRTTSSVTSRRRRARRPIAAQSGGTSTPC